MNPPREVYPAGWTCYYGAGPFATRREAWNCRCRYCREDRETEQTVLHSLASLSLTACGVLLLVFVVWQIVWGVTA